MMRMLLLLVLLAGCEKPPPCDESNRGQIYKLRLQYPKMCMKLDDGSHRWIQIRE